MYGLSRDDDEVPMKNVTDNIKIKMMVGVNKDVIQQWDKGVKYWNYALKENISCKYLCSVFTYPCYTNEVLQKLNPLEKLFNLHCLYSHSASY